VAEVYALEHPDTGVTWYIGYTCGYARERYSAHLSDRATPAVRRWVSFLRAQGKVPVLRVLAVTTPERARALERHLIGRDASLLNVRYAKRAYHRDTDHIPSDLDDNCPDSLENN
jgi:hypothetical protein